MTTEAGLELFWLPLGAGGHSVRGNGRVYEAACALLAHREACDLYHSALRVHLPSGSWTIEMTPVWAATGSAERGSPDRGIVAEGAVGTRLTGHARLFRYEVHCWRDGTIADLGEAVGGPVQLSSDPALCRRLLALLPQVPHPVWGRDELRTGEMWNSNSVTSWALTRSGLDTGSSITCRPDGHQKASRRSSQGQRWRQQATAEPSRCQRLPRRAAGSARTAAWSRSTGPAQTVVLLGVLGLRSPDPCPARPRAMLRSTL